MNSLTILYLIVAFLGSILLVYLSYFYKERQTKATYYLSTLRFLTIFGLLFLLINPKIKNTSYDIVKPKLLVAVDNSSSIRFSNQDTVVRKIFRSIKENKELNEKFDCNFFTFGNVLKDNSELTFEENQTNIIEGLKGLNSIGENHISPIVLISDGNQTFGSNYKYYNSNQVIYPIIIGDTAQISDLEITKINLNRFTYLDNKFPVEVFIRYSGNAKISSKYIVSSNESIIYEKKVDFSKEENVVRLEFLLSARNVGKHLYKSKIEPFKDEKNKINNFKNFSIDAIDEQSKIALIYDVLHPDIGALKNSIEINPQRKVNLMDINVKNQNIEENNIYILYQPNIKFKSFFDELKNSSKNYFIITGKNTDWNFLNNSQEIFAKNKLSDIQEYLPEFNNNFLDFHLDDIGFSNLPPLEDWFGEIKFSVPYQSILTQNIDGISTDYPLLANFNSSNQRGIVLFGENIWKWRTLTYSLEQSFERFDNFLNTILQYLTITTKTNQIDLEYNSFYYTDEPVAILAKSYDSNFNFDQNENLELYVENEKNGIPFLLKRNNLEAKLTDLEAGDYNFKVKSIQNNKSASGKFTIFPYTIEQESSQANGMDLQYLANNSKGKAFYPSQIQVLYEELMNNPNLVTVQKEYKQIVSLINYKWLLGIIVLSLLIEWFLRKYLGLI